MRYKIASMIVMFISMTYPFYSSAEDRHESEHETVQKQTQWYYLSSFGTDQVFRFEEDTGEFLGVLDTRVPGPFASCIGTDGDFFVAAQTTGEILRYDGVTGALKGAIVKAGSGGLTQPTAPILTPDGKYMLVGDLVLNGYLRYNGQTGEFIDVFAEASTSPIDGPFMPIFSPYPDFRTKILIASGFTNSIQIYDIETGKYEGDFVKPASGGLNVPIGLTFGPDGNLYTSSSGTSSIKRYNGKTGEYIDDFVPAGSGGLSAPRALEFGGSNSDLYVVSNDTNNVLRYDRSTGAFLGESASGGAYGFGEPRGLMFTARPNFFIEATPSVVTGTHHRYAHVEVKVLTDNDVIDASPKIELLSITVNGEDADDDEDVKGSRIGKDVRKFLLRTGNDSGSDKVYTFTYRASNSRGGSMVATTTVTIPPSVEMED